MSQANKMDEKEITKINFFKKFYNSLFKFSKYEEMTKEGVRSSLTYILIIIAIIVLVLTGFFMNQLKTSMQNCAKYLNENIEDITLKNYQLTSSTIIQLDSDEMKDLFGITVIVDTENTEDEAKEKYNESMQNKTVEVILLKDKLIAINLNNDGSVNTYSYSDALANIIKDSEKEYNKQDLVDYFNNYAVANSFVNYYSYYLIIYIVQFATMIFMLSILGYLTQKVLKVKFKKNSQIISLTIYSMTLSMIIYLIYLVLNYFTKISISYLWIVYIIVAYAYIIAALMTRKKQDKIKEEDVEK